MTRDQCIALMLKFEGGDSNNPADPGGATRGGITQRTLDALRQRAEFNHYPASVFDLSEDQIVAIYELTDWAQIHGDALPSAVACVLLNIAVNEGEPMAVRLLQAAVSVREDGLLGAETLQAVATWRSAYMRGQSLAEELCARAAVRYAELDAHEAEFELGWMRRLFRCFALASGLE